MIVDVTERVRNDYKEKCPNGMDSSDTVCKQFGWTLKCLRENANSWNDRNKCGSFYPGGQVSGCSGQTEHTRLGGAARLFFTYDQCRAVATACNFDPGHRENKYRLNM